MPRTPPKTNTSYLWKSMPENVAKPRPRTPTPRARSGSECLTPRSASQFSLPPAHNECTTPTATSPTDPLTYKRLTVQSSQSPRRSPRNGYGAVSPRYGAIESRMSMEGEEQGIPLRRPEEHVVLTPPRPQLTSGASPPAQPQTRSINLTFAAPVTINHGGYAAAPSSLAPVLNRKEYYAKPSIEKLSRMTEKELSAVDNLEIGRYGLGNITWPGLTDVRGLDFDDLIDIDQGVVSVYKDENNKPPQGQGLNKRAIVKLSVKPTHAPKSEKHKNKYIDRLRQKTEEAGNQFMSYDLSEWVFAVEHFSKHGVDANWDADLFTDESEDSEVEEEKKLPISIPVQSPIQPAAIMAPTTGTAGFVPSAEVAERLMAWQEAPVTPEWELRPAKTPRMEADFATAVPPTRQQPTGGILARAPVPSSSVQEDYLPGDVASRQVRGAKVPADVFQAFSFRPAFGAGGTMVVPYTCPDTGTHRIQIVRMNQENKEQKKQQQSQFLEAHLEKAVIRWDKDPHHRIGYIPRLQFTNKHDMLVGLLRKLQTLSQGYLQETFELLDAAFGDRDELAAFSKSLMWEDPQMTRRMALNISDWFRTVNTRKLMPAIQDLEKKAEIRGESAENASAYLLEAAFLNLCANNVQDATRQILKCPVSYEMLAWAVAAMGGRVNSTPARALMKKQVDQWMNDKVESMMPEEVWKIWSLLGLDLDSTAAEAVDWRTSFAIYLWYRDDQDNEFSDAFNLYKEGCDNDAHKVQLAVPPYMSQNAGDGYDLQFMICLAAAGHIDIDDFTKFDAKTYSKDRLDVAQSWHVCTILAMFKQHLTRQHECFGAEACEDKSRQVLGNLTASFIEQLEMLGLWEWAVFVSTLSCDASVSRAIIDRHIQLDDQTPILKRFNVPNAWIECGKALRAKYLKEYALAVDLYIAGGEHLMALNILLDELFYPAVLVELTGGCRLWHWIVDAMWRLAGPLQLQSKDKPNLVVLDEATALLDFCNWWGAKPLLPFDDLLVKLDRIKGLVDRGLPLSQIYSTVWRVTCESGNQVLDQVAATDTQEADHLHSLNQRVINLLASH